MQVHRLRRDRANYGADKTTRGSARNDDGWEFSHMNQTIRSTEPEVYSGRLKIAVIPSEGGLPRVFSSAGYPEPRDPHSLSVTTNLLFQANCRHPERKRQ